LALNIINDDDKQSVIRLIKVSEELTSRSSDQPTHVFNISSQILPQSTSKGFERFKQIDQNIRISEDRLVAKCLITDRFNGSSVHGIQCYSTDIHHIRFRIEQRTSEYLFVGITTLNQSNFRPAFAAPSANG
jgi:hypothetical protein